MDDLPRPSFWERAGDVCGLYLNPPENAVVWSVDEKSGIQAKSRINPTRPAVPRHSRAPGVRVPSPRHRRALCRLDVHEGTVAGWVTTHASWLNQVELFFSILERRLLRRGEFDSVDDLADRIIAFIKDYNRRAAPFRWTYDGRPLMAA
ncbi:MAG TPA: hypothetical protein VK988_14095 [Acidimicrobiales bacterium]|nr:hypothetical protein [Acidimicrobiales bacterium]